MIEVAVKFALSYLLGSIMGGLVVGRLRGVDIRTQGSGNAGATNALRTQGPVFGLLVFVIDVGKGVLAALWIPGLSFAEVGLSPPPVTLVAGIPYICGFGAFAGHVYPVYFGFRGGKGVATLLGVMVCLLPQTLIFFGVVWVITLILTGYVGVASILGFVAATVAISAKAGLLSAPAVFMYGALTLVLYTHRTNIQRLRDGSEHRFEKAMLFRRRRRA